MNERLKQLAEQATTIVEMVGPQGYASSYANFDREKFALLIVKECAQLARDTDLEDIEGGDSEVLRAAKRQILEHFGVEE
jgi:hypothetical protein